MRLLIGVNYRARGSETYAPRMRRRLPAAEAKVHGSRTEIRRRLDLWIDLLTEKICIYHTKKKAIKNKSTVDSRVFTQRNCLRRWFVFLAHCRLSRCSVLVSHLSKKYGLAVTAFAARQLDVSQKRECRAGFRRALIFLF